MRIPRLCRALCRRCCFTRVPPRVLRVYRPPTASSSIGRLTAITDATAPAAVISTVALSAPLLPVVLPTVVSAAVFPLLLLVVEALVLSTTLWDGQLAQASILIVYVLHNAGMIDPLHAVAVSVLVLAATSTTTIRGDGSHLRCCMSCSATSIPQIVAFTSGPLAVLHVIPGGLSSPFL